MHLYYLVYILIRLLYSYFLGFLTLPTAYVTGNPVECVLHPNLWNKSHVWDPLGVGQVYTDQYEEDNVGHPVTTVSRSVSPQFEYLKQFS